MGDGMKSILLGLAALAGMNWSGSSAGNPAWTLNNTMAALKQAPVRTTKGKKGSHKQNARRLKK